VYTVKSVITFRLRKELDADLIALGIDENSLPDLCRNGLRLMLGIQTAKQVEVKERPIVTQQVPQKQIPGKPAKFNPKVGGVWSAQKS
jgi:hypothetical protein